MAGGGGANAGTRRALSVHSHEERWVRGGADGARGAVISASPSTPPSPPAPIGAGRTRGADYSASWPAAAHVYAATECLKDRYAGAGAAARGCKVREMRGRCRRLGRRCTQRLADDTDLRMHQWGARHRRR